MTQRFIRQNSWCQRGRQHIQIILTTYWRYYNRLVLRVLQLFPSHYYQEILPVKVTFRLALEIWIGLSKVCQREYVEGGSIIYQWKGKSQEAGRLGIAWEEKGMWLERSVGVGGGRQDGRVSQEFVFYSIAFPFTSAPFPQPPKSLMTETLLLLWFQETNWGQFITGDPPLTTLPKIICF